MANTGAEEERLIRELIDAVPEFQTHLTEHIEFNHELLPHLLFGDLTRWVIDLYRDTQRIGPFPQERNDILERTLQFLEDRFANAQDSAAHDLITASFLENLHQAGPDYSGIKQRMGPSLRNWLTRLE